MHTQQQGEGLYKCCCLRTYAYRARGECMCMDAHVPSQWDICGNSELAVMAKLAKMCQGRDPSEGCNMYHWDLAQALCHRNPEFKQGEWRLWIREKRIFHCLGLQAAFLLWSSQWFVLKSAFTVHPVLRLQMCTDETVIGWNTVHRIHAHEM